MEKSTSIDSGEQPGLLVPNLKQAIRTAGLPHYSKEGGNASFDLETDEEDGIVDESSIHTLCKDTPEVMYCSLCSVVHTEGAWPLRMLHDAAARHSVITE